MPNLFENKDLGKVGANGAHTRFLFLATGRQDVFSRRALTWRREGAAHVVCHGRRRLLCVVPDAAYPTMWRVRVPDGKFGDIKNVAWARHEAARVALSILNEKHHPGRAGNGSLTGTDAEPVSSPPRLRCGAAP